MRHILIACLLSLFWLSASAQQAEPPPPTEQHFGRDTVYFSVFNTTFLTPEVAQSYGITRGKYNFLITVAVRRQGAADEPVRAEVTGTTFDMIHREPLSFLEVIEQDAVYYIASFEIANTEKRNFQLEVVAEGEPHSYSIEFNKKLYVDK